MNKILFILFFCAVNTITAQNINPVITSNIYTPNGRINPKEDWVWIFYSEGINIVDGEVYKIRNGFWITPTEYIYPYGRVSVYKNYIAWEQKGKNWCVTIKCIIKN